MVFERIQRRSIRPHANGHRDVGIYYGLRVERNPFCLPNPSRLGPRAVSTCIASPCYLVLFLGHSKDWPSMVHGVLSVWYDDCTPTKERAPIQARTDDAPQAEGWAKCPFPACHRIEKPGNNTEKSGDSRKLDLRPVNVLRFYLRYSSCLVQASPIMPCRSVSLCYALLLVAGQEKEFEDAALRAHSSPYLVGYDPHAYKYWGEVLLGLGFAHTT